MATTKPTLFEYVVVWHPNELQEKEGKKSTLVDGPKCMIAKEEKAVFMTAVSLLPTEYKDQLDQIDVIVRPF
jgi:hypothetical protein